MVKKVFHLLILFLLISNSVEAQETLLLYKTAVKGHQMSTDNLGQVYLYKDDELLKYDPEGRLLQRYSDKKAGRITTVDPRNPFRILLFYKDQGLIRVLDNMLAVTGEIRLADAGFFQPAAIASSYNSTFWVYDLTNSTLARLTLDLAEVARIENMGLQTGHQIHPERMEEYSNHLIMHQPGKGLYIFDVFGNYLRQVRDETLTAFQPREESIILMRQDSAFRYSIRTMSDERLQLPSGGRSVRFEKDRMYRLAQDSLFIYRFIP